jgi:hypothetical protein
MKKQLFILGTLLLLVFTSSCDKDDSKDQNKFIENDLIGNWEAHWDMPPVYTEKITKKGDHIVMWNEKDGENIITIDKDGEVRFYDSKSSFVGQMNDAKDRIEGHYDDEELYFLKIK